MSLENRVFELAAHVAELTETVVELSGRLAASDQIAAEVRELVAALKAQKPPEAQFSITVPPAPVAPVNVAAPAAVSCDFEITTTGPDGRAITSVLRRVREH